MPTAFAKAWMDRDANALAGLFHESAAFVNLVGLWWHDRESIWKAHEYGLRVIFAESTLIVRQVKAKPIGEKDYLVQARFKLTGQSTGGGVEKFEKGWLCIAGHNTD